MISMEFISREEQIPISMLPFRVFRTSFHSNPMGTSDFILEER
jgi:hypothetical protein